jgi:hypothetical protein
MLYNGVNHFNWFTDNYAGEYVGNSGVTTLTADAVAHTKGTAAALLAGVAYDVWGIAVMVSASNTDATIRRSMIDLLIDPAAGVGNAGSSWSVLINNIYSNSSAIGSGTIGHAFYFPMFVPAGTAFGAQYQDVVGGSTCKFSIRVYGQPTRPDLVKVGTKCQTIGATTASTTGVAVTPGTAAIGSYGSSMGTLTNDAWWWQVGVGSNDTTMSVNTYRFDVAADATSKYICIDQLIYQIATTTGELSGKAALGQSNTRHIAAGSDVYTRGAAGATPDGTMTTVVYAVT